MLPRPEYHAEIVERAQRLTSMVRGEVQAILNGLADRPKPGDKATAREAAKRILQANYELWAFIQGHTPPDVTNDEMIAGWSQVDIEKDANIYLLIPPNVARMKFLFQCCGNSSHVHPARCFLEKTGMVHALEQAHRQVVGLPPCQVVWFAGTDDAELAAQFVKEFC